VLYFFVQGLRTPLGPTKLHPFRGHNGNKVWNEDYKIKDGKTGKGEFLWNDDQDIQD
jgi:hypothetical protein